MSRNIFDLAGSEDSEAVVKTKQFVIFTIADDHFGVPVGQVIQVQNYERVTRIPGAPNYVLGVLNLRGTIVTLIDLKKRLYLGDESEFTNGGHVLFVEMDDQIVGMLVDKVHTLEAIPVNVISDELTMISSQIPLEYLTGAANLNDQIIVLLDLKKILSDYESEQIFKEQERLDRILKTKEEPIPIPVKQETKEEDSDSSKAKAKAKAKKTSTKKK